MRSPSPLDGGRRVAGFEPCRSAPGAGFALPAALLALVLLALTSSAAVHLALHEGLVVRADERLLRARMGSETGVRLWSHELARGMADAEAGPDGWPAERTREGELGGGAVYRVRLGPLDVEHALLEGRGWHAGGPGPRHRVGRLLWRPHPARRLARVEAVVAHGGELWQEGPGRIEPDPVGDPAWLEPGGPGGERCDPFRERVHAALDGRSPASHARVSIPGPRVALGRRTGPGFRQVVDRPEDLPREGPEGGDADEGGSEDGVEDGGQRLRVASGGLVLTSGTLEGILWVDGDLEVAGTANVRGLVLVDGDLLVEDEAEVEGHARVRGDVGILDAGTIRGSGCALLEALEGVAGATRPRSLPDGGWVSLPLP